MNEVALDGNCRRPGCGGFHYGTHYCPYGYSPEAVDARALTAARIAIYETERPSQERFEKRQAAMNDRHARARYRQRVFRRYARLADSGCLEALGDDQRERLDT